VKHRWYDCGFPSSSRRLPATGGVLELASVRFCAAAVLIALFLGSACSSLAQGDRAREIGKSDIWRSGAVNEVLWISDNEVLLFGTGRRHSIYASAVDIRNRKRRSLRALSSRLTESAAQGFLLGFLFLSPDGHRLLWMFHYVDESLAHTSDLEGKRYTADAANAEVTGWMSDSRHFTGLTGPPRSNPTQFLIKSPGAAAEAVSIPIDPAVQLNGSEEFWFPDDGTVVVGRSVTSATKPDNLELTVLVVGATVTVKARYDHRLPPGDHLADVALSRDGKHLAVLTTRRDALDMRRDTSVRNRKKLGFHYALLTKDTAEHDFHVVSPRLVNSHDDGGVRAPAVSGLSWSPGGRTAGFMVDDRVFVLDLPTMNTLTPKTREPLIRAR
jgi:hypothetical protein